MSSQVSALKLLDLIQSHRVTAVIYVAARLGLAELLRDGPQPLGTLAEATGADERALGRLLTTLATIGLCSRAGEDSYALTEIGACLDSAAERSIKGWVIFEAEMLAKSWSSMFDTIMSGKNAAELQGYANSFELMGKTPENVERFNAAMVDHTRLVTPDILQSYDFSAITHLMDVGGGSGELLGAIARQSRQLPFSTFRGVPRSQANIFSRSASATAWNLSPAISSKPCRQSQMRLSSRASFMTGTMRAASRFFGTAAGRFQTAASCCWSSG
jgi:hypothetical protein